MNKRQQIGFGINILGLILFVVWFIVKDRLPTSVSIIFAILFLGLLLVSIFIMLRATQQNNKDHSK